MIIEQFSFSSTAARISVITFSDKAKIMVPFNTNQTHEQFQKAVDEVDFIGYRTKIGDAFKLANTLLYDTKHGARADAKKMAVLITDARDAHDTTDKELLKAYKASKLLLEKKTTIAAIGMFGTHKTDVELLQHLTGNEEDIYLIEHAPDLLLSTFLRGFSHNYCE